MFLQTDDEQLGRVLGLVLVVAAGVIGITLGAALQREPAGTVTTPPAAVTPTLPLAAALAPVVPAIPSAQSVRDAAGVTVENGVVKFYFASGSADLAGGAADALVDVVTAAKGGKKVLIAGFHDSRGNALTNIELGRRRALAVRQALQAAGVPDRQISLQKPAPAGPGLDAEARRVEITLQ